MSVRNIKCFKNIKFSQFLQLQNIVIGIKQSMHVLHLGVNDKRRGLMGEVQGKGEGGRVKV